MSSQIRWILKRVTEKDLQTLINLSILRENEKVHKYLLEN